MSTAQKVGLVAGGIAQFGLEAALAAVELPRSTWYHQRGSAGYAGKYAHLRQPLEEIARQHPEYGYRRTAVELREGYGIPVNRKVVQRLHRLWDLPLIRNTRTPKPSGIRQAITAAGERVNLVARLEEIGPFEVLHTDFTDLRHGIGVAKLIAIICHVSKLSCGWAVGERANTELALAAWGRAKATFEELGIDLEGVIVHHDQDPVFTGYGWTSQLLLEDHVRLSYALNGAKDNTEMESFFSRFKNENHSLFAAAQGPGPLGVLVDERMQYFNRERRHSSLGYVAPLSYVETLHPGGR